MRVLSLMLLFHMLSGVVTLSSGLHLAIYLLSSLRQCILRISLPLHVLLLMAMAMEMRTLLTQGTARTTRTPSDLWAP